jgi:TolB protein
VGWPRYSPDGKKIVFAAWLPVIGPEIYVMNPDGTGITRLTFTGMKSSNPSWSPDGTTIAFQRNDVNGTPGVWTMDANGGNQKMLVSCPFPGCSRPKFSPVANEIAYEHVDFTGISMVDGTSGALTGDIPGSDHDQMPTWSKDRTRIIFSSLRGQNGGLDLFSTVPVRGAVTAPVPAPPVDRLTSFIGNEISAAYSR